MSTQASAAVDSTAIYPFSANFPQEEITELRRRIAATRWPERECVEDWSRAGWADANRCT